MSAYGELTLPPLRPDRNRVTGKFLKGNRPWNKGMNPKDYLSEKDYADMMARARVNGHKNAGKPRPLMRRKVVAVYPDGRWRVFDGVISAAEHFGVRGTRVSSTCRANNRTIRGVRVFYESDNRWIDAVSKS